MAHNSPLKNVDWKKSLYLIIVSAGSGFVATDWFRGSMDLIMTPLASASIVLVCIVLLAYGLRVRRWNNRPRPTVPKGSPPRTEQNKNSSPRSGPRPRLDPIQAVRTVILAQASIITASLLIGWHSGVVVFRLDDWLNHIPYATVFNVTLALLVSIALLIIGFLVQKWCRIPPEDMRRNRALPATEPTFKYK